MTYEDLQEVVHRRPFEPFRLLISTGITFDIRHPDLIVVERRSAQVGVTRDPDGELYYRSVKIDLLHVVAIEELPTSGAGTNGSS